MFLYVCVFALVCVYYILNHQGGEISLIWLVERSAIKMLILHVTGEK